ncbi:S1 family peptidase [Micromonospora sp. LOL_021]|uniref:S1 family peptidase n=1 Tax=Micromonospora sp. LOL_021 TaxID=3345417 RepID=UPI003A896852
MRLRQLLAVAVTALVGAVTTPSTAAAAPQQIIGGDTVLSAPWAAAVYSDGSFRCSGSMIASRWVLTAEHCIGGSMSVRVGSVHHATGGQVSTVSVTYSQYGYLYDVGLLYLSTPISTTYVTLATSDPPVGSTNTIYGWGRTCLNCHLSPQLKTASVQVVSVRGRDAYEGPALRSSPVTGIAWQGDSGGPQFYNGQQVGVCSNSNGSSSQNYSSVAASRDWITSITGV